MPNNISDYIHQIGRAGRLGTKGYSYSFVNEKNQKLFYPLVKILKDGNFIIPHQILNNKFYISKRDNIPIKKRIFIIIVAKISSVPRSADPIYLHEWKKWQKKNK